MTVVTTQQRLAFATLIFVGILAGSSEVASAQVCRVYNKTWTVNLGGSQVTITVLMNDTAEYGLHLGSGLGIPATEAAVRQAISEWNGAGANFKLVYGGRTQLTQSNGFITLIGDDITPKPDTALASTFITDGGGAYLLYARVLFNRKKLNGTFRVWTTNTDLTVEEPYDFTGTLVHELGHALDFAHTDDPDPSAPCNYPDIESVMRTYYGFTVPDRTLRYWDKISIQSNSWYWKKNGKIRARKLTEGGSPSWGAAFVSPTGAMWPGLSAGQNGVWITTAHGWAPSSGVGGRARNYVVQSNNTFQYPTTLADETLNSPAVATSDLPNGLAIMVVTTGEYIDTNLTKNFYYFLSTDNGQTFDTTPHCITSNGQCLPWQSRGGASVAYDPRSKAFLISWAAFSGDIVVHTLPTSYSTVPAAITFLNNYTFDAAPTIACRDAVNGCRIAYEDRGSNNCLKWVEAQVNLVTGQIDVGVTRTQCWVLYNAPAIAYDKNTARYRLLFHQQNGAIFSREMAATGTTWSGLPDFGNPAGFISAPVLGTQWFCFFGCSGYTEGFALEW